ncbi:hypothetical protein [Demequina zhanjiangensis]|uniref:DNA modification methylase n=1 Tax=Demequina zhanjiangensis TaxID=3051659 RepID=A0ABT8FYJ8_9MICO|nr:hypothetical protein [Demequina sp. SYSU T00b26]MDN4471968.1 hypothetical protein [Demequina sp. SYSU T00b26]
MKLQVTARIAAAAIVALSLASCSFAASITTSQQYSASDGVRLELEDVTGLNLLVISTDEGAPAALIGSFDNSGDEPVSVTVGLGGEDTSFTVPAGGVVALGLDEDETAVVGTSTAAPGLIASVSVETPRSGMQDVDVPVLDGTLEEYADTLEMLQSVAG